MEKSDFINYLEENLPEYVVILLNTSGFDSIQSFSCLGKKSIEEIKTILLSEKPDEDHPLNEKFVAALQAQQISVTNPKIKAGHMELLQNMAQKKMSETVREKSVNNTNATTATTTTIDLVNVDSTAQLIQEILPTIASKIKEAEEKNLIIETGCTVKGVDGTTWTPPALSKYRGIKYSRFHREMRKRKPDEVPEKCQKITKFFSSEVKCQSDGDEARIEGIVKQPEPPKTNEIESDMKNWLLKVLNESSQRNPGKSSGNRYSEEMKKAFSYLQNIAGKMTYEFLYMNLPIPCAKTIQNHIKHDYRPTCEGDLDFDGLKNYLVVNNFPMKVAIGEDATRVLSLVEYHKDYNCLLGLVAPLAENGLPKKAFFKAASAKQIINNIQNGKKANYVIAIVAQPVILGASSFILGIFGTDNKFEYPSVISRWTYILRELKIRGIKVCAFGSDGDSRYLKAQKEFIHYSKKHLKFGEVMKCEPNDDFAMIQDPPHLCNKIKNRLFEIHNHLILGNFVACIGHLKILLKNVPKSAHGLNYEDINSEDRMNFDAVKKICKSSIYNLLKENVPQSEGTIAVLKLIECIFMAYIDENADTKTRIYNAWYALFFTRIWKNWIKEEKKSADHFLTSNAYDGMEINAHMILHFSQSEDYVDVNFSLLNSQMCEYTFRTLRSMTSTYDTRVNFSVKDVLSRIHKLQANQVITQVMNEKLEFRENLKKRSLKTIFNEKLNESDLRELLMTSKSAAQYDCRLLGMCDTSDQLMLTLTHSSSLSTKSCLSSNELNEKNFLEIQSFQISNEDEISFVTSDLESSLMVKEETEFQNLLFDNEETENSYVGVLNHPSGIKYLSKRTLCHFLNQKERISSDRLRRFHVKQSKQQITTDIDTGSHIVRKPSIYIGDFVVVKDSDNSLYVGQVLGLQFINVKFKKEKKFLSDFYVFPTGDMIDKNPKKVGMLASWFLVTKNKELTIMATKEIFDTKLYKGHILLSSIDMINLKLKCDDLSEILLNAT